MDKVIVNVWYSQQEGEFKQVVTDLKYDNNNAPPSYFADQAWGYLQGIDNDSFVVKNNLRSASVGDVFEVIVQGQSHILICNHTGWMSPDLQFLLDWMKKPFSHAILGTTFE